MATGKTTTRKGASCPVFGSPSELSGNVLPTFGDIMKFYVWTKNNLKISSETKEPTVAEISEVVAVRIEEIWMKASIPVVSHTRVLQLLRAYHDKYMKLLKPLKERQKQEKYKERLKSFKEEGQCKLFDIAACKCELVKCTCAKVRKVPVNEHTFLIDQRTTRLMFISSAIDKGVSKKLLAKRKRQLAEVNRAANYRQSREKNPTDDIMVSSEETGLSESEDEMPLAQVRANLHQVRATTNDLVGANSNLDYELNKSSVSGTPARLKRDLPALARACDRHGISDRSAAAIASAVLQDFGLILPEDQGNVVDRNKVRRARQRKRNNLQQNNKESQDVLHSLFFDGRKDHTITNVQKGSKWYRMNVVEEHISLIEEPGSKYIGHVTPASGTSEAIKLCLMNFLNERYSNLFVTVLLLQTCLIT
jgi:hypothetical protein